MEEGLRSFAMQSLGGDRNRRKGLFTTHGLGGDEKGGRDVCVARPSWNRTFS